MVNFLFVRSYLSFDKLCEKPLVNWIATGIIVFLLTGIISDYCYSAESAGSSKQDKRGQVETEQIGPDYSLELSEQKFLRHEGKRIDSIRIKRLDVFDSSVNDTTRVKRSRIEKVLNRISFNTRESTIRQNLLFKEGDRIDPYVLADSERLLWDLDFIKDARIVVIPDKLNNDSVSILVIVKDQWSLMLTGSQKQGNGFSLSMTERNIGGLGHQISSSMSYISPNPLRFGINYSVQNIHGSFVTGKLTYLKLADIKMEGLEFSRELVSPVLKYSGGLEISRTSRKIEDSLPFFTDNDYNLMGFWVGRRIHFKVMKNDIDRRRTLVISGRFRMIQFIKRPIITNSTWYRYHDKTYYLGNIAFIQHRYYRTNLLYDFGQTENIPYGFLVNLTSGIIDNSIRTRWYISTALAAGKRIERLGYGAGKVSFSGCPVGGTIKLGILKMQILYFTDIVRFGGFRFRQFFKTEYLTGMNRFSDDSIDFSIAENIRGVGYKHKVTGTQHLLLSSDTVVFTPWRVKGITITLFSFADVDIIGSSHRKIFSQNYYSGLGLGIRLHSETIGIKTVELRFTWYPRLPLEHKAYGLSPSVGNRIIPIDFIRSKPEILDY